MPTATPHVNAAAPSPDAPPAELARSLQGLHHVALIASDYAASRRFYVEVLGCQVFAENFRAERNSWKLDLALPDGTQLELFSFPGAPPRPTRPEACGLRHLALRVARLEPWLAHLQAHGVATEEVRRDEFTGRRFVFFRDPDALPLELVEMDEAVRTGAAVLRPAP